MKSRQRSGGASRSAEARELSTWARRVSQAAILGTMIAGICASSAAFAETKPAVTAGHETVDDDGDAVPQVAVSTSSANTVTVPDDAVWSIDQVKIVEARGLRPVPMAPITGLSIHTDRLDIDYIPVGVMDATILSQNPDGSSNILLDPPHREPGQQYSAYAYRGNNTQVGVDVVTEGDMQVPHIVLGADAHSQNYVVTGVPNIAGHAERGRSKLAPIAKEGNLLPGDQIVFTTPVARITTEVVSVIYVGKTIEAAEAAGNPASADLPPGYILLSTCNAQGEEGNSDDAATAILRIVDTVALAA